MYSHGQQNAFTTLGIVTEKLGGARGWARISEALQRIGVPLSAIPGPDKVTLQTPSPVIPRADRYRARDVLDARAKSTGNDLWDNLMDPHARDFTLEPVSRFQVLPSSYELRNRLRNHARLRGD